MNIYEHWQKITEGKNFRNNGLCLEIVFQDFPGGAVVKNPPANAGDTSLSTGPGRSHMPQSN